MKRLYVGLLIGGLLYVTIKELLLYPVLRQRSPAHTNSPSNLRFVTTTRGSQKKVALPDGSIVWLNAASMLSYPVDMATGDRSVQLFGEAFFEVVPNPSRPFRLTARDMNIQVLGTRFNVRNYPDEVFTRTLVNSGSIKVSYMGQSATLLVGDEAEIDPEGLNGRALSVKSRLDTTSANSWMKGQLTFNDVDLRSLLRNLSRSYDVDIQLIGPVSNHRYNGSLSITESLDEVIERLIVPYEHASISHPDKKRLIIVVKG